MSIYGTAQANGVARHMMTAEKEDLRPRPLVFRAIVALVVTGSCSKAAPRAFGAPARDPAPRLPSGRIYRICNQKKKARQTQNTKQRHKRPQHTTYYSGPQMSRKGEQMQYKCRVHMQSKCTMLNTTWTLIHTKGLLNIRMASCAKQSHICSQWFMHSLVCMPCMSTSIAQLIKYYATNAIPC